MASEMNGWMNLDEWVMWHIIWESIYDWGTKERKKDFRIFVGLLFANNMYLKQI
jgi:hypothetical protein